MLPDEDGEHEEVEPSQPGRSQPVELNHDESSGDERPPSGKVTTAEKHLQGLSADEVERKVKDLVRLALATEHRKQPLKRDDINKKVLKDHTRAFAAVFQRAQERLRQTFGVEMVEMASREKRQTAASQTSKRAAVMKGEKSSTRAYLLRSILSAEERSIVNWGDQQPTMVLLCIILGIMLVNGRRIEEGHLLVYLRRLGIRQGKEHSIFGSIEAALTEYVKQAYLDRVKEQGVDADTYEYMWGPRAKIELPEANLIEFMSGVYPDLAPEAKQRLGTDIKRLAGPADQSTATQGDGPVASQS
ncbi:hypothetical protein SpCBS45565_g06824 [Spizellomyces sp. 'palustris']|nr:hypothetical protein SpCBS45565_g06824 [Spizellomyces sp. 'palustris']